MSDMAKKAKTKLSEWQKLGQLGGVCSSCGVKVSYLTVDHIIPISIVNMLDYSNNDVFENEENFQFLCRPCNTLKASRLDIRNPKTKVLLLKLLDQGEV